MPFFGSAVLLYWLGATRPTLCAWSTFKNWKFSLSFLGDWHAAYLSIDFHSFLFTVLPVYRCVLWQIRIYIYIICIENKILIQTNYVFSDTIMSVTWFGTYLCPVGGVTLFWSTCVPWGGALKGQAARQKVESSKGILRMNFLVLLTACAAVRETLLEQNGNS